MRRVLPALVVIVVLMLALVPAAAAHTVVWNPATYTTPIRDYPNDHTYPYTGSKCVIGYGHAPNTGAGNSRALDLQVIKGSTVYAPKGGTVSFSGWQGGGGIVININHPDGMQTVLAHLNQTLVGAGQVVSKNQVIGYSGASGWGSYNYYGAHLHWGLKVTGHSYDSHNGDAYAAPLDEIPGVLEQYNPDVVCGTP